MPPIDREEKLMSGINELIRLHYANPKEAILDLLKVTAFFTQMHARNGYAQELSRLAAIHFYEYLKAWENVGEKPA